MLFMFVLVYICLICLIVYSIDLIIADVKLALQYDIDTIIKEKRKAIYITMTIMFYAIDFI